MARSSIDEEKEDASRLSAVIRLTERLMSVTVCLSSLEVLYKPEHINDKSLESWTVSRERRRLTSSGPLAGVFDTVLSYPAVLIMISLRLLAALALIFAPFKRPIRGLLVFSLAVSTFALQLRSVYGKDGSEHMSQHVFTALTFEKLFPEGSTESKACVWYIALQSCLSYFASGLAKIFGPTWRSGSALSGIFRTSSYGDDRIYRFTKEHPKLTKWLSHSGVLWESMFPVVLFAPRPVRYLILVNGVAFHAANAVFMGLSRFFWAFLATYPAVSYCAELLSRSKR